jgi:hypothetical protein
MWRRDSRAIALPSCFSEDGAKFGGGLRTERNACIPEGEEIHYADDERCSRQLLSLVSIYLESIQAAGGVSVSESTEKSFDPLASRVGFLF